MQFVILFLKFLQLCPDEIEHGFVSTKFAVRSGKVVWIANCLNKTVKIFEKSIKEDNVTCTYRCEGIPVLFDIFMNYSILTGIVVNVPLVKVTIIRLQILHILCFKNLGNS